MRRELASSNNKRDRFTATFIRFGSKHLHKGTTATTLLFLEIRNKEGRVVADHVWFTMTKGFENCCLRPGERIAFDARVQSYTKGYKGLPKQMRMMPQHDYKLSHPTRIIKIDNSCTDTK
ncbi:MAG TPA: hypothetical protein VNR87_11000 [Flavisolibacter sp.]|nr:hypothetical protein [Flavisolibacter sp.]